MSNLATRIRRSWNVFRDRNPDSNNDEGLTFFPGYLSESYRRPDRIYLSTNNFRRTVAAIYNQIAVDISSITINHVRLDEEGRFKEVINDDLNRCLTLEANIDQTGRDLIRDCCISLFDEGAVAIVPTVLDDDPKDTDSYKIYELRVGRIIRWSPYHVVVDIYNPLKGEREELRVEKRLTTIIENPFYEIMNEPNSAAQRLMRILNQIDKDNNIRSSGKLDLLIQFPYLAKSPIKKNLATKRRKEIEEQIDGSTLGIGFIDSTEKVIQLNRSLENNLWQQALDTKQELFNQLGYSQKIFDGTADEQTMLNYYSRIIEPTLSAITENMQRKWISRTAESQGQAIRFYRDPFKLVPVGQMAELADKFKRNEVLTSNEIRSGIGFKPSSDEKADELRNSNLNHPDEETISNG